ncbi:hypothetical protein [Xenorhabdus siamensis]|uniref:hypothetical protein n=1 Tax=Xenorhabdus siamensis TaxID=3136254 RepID=UPI0030F3E75E
MNQENLVVPSKDELDAIFTQSNDMYEQEQLHYEAIAKEKPELAHFMSVDILILTHMSSMEVIRLFKYHLILF